MTFAQVVAIEAIKGMPSMRRVRVKTNLGPPPKPLTLRVAGDTSAGDEILYFRPVDPLGEYLPEDYLKPGAELTANRLAKLLAGMDEDEKKDPPGDMKRLATELRWRWLERGWITVEPKGTAKIMRITPARWEASALSARVGLDE